MKPKEAGSGQALMTFPNMGKELGGHLEKPLRGVAEQGEGGKATGDVDFGDWRRGAVSLTG